MAMDGMDVSVVQPIVSTLGNAITELTQLGNTVTSGLSTAGENWQGATATSFNSSLGSASTQFKSAVQALEQLVTDLTQAYQAYANASTVA